MIRALNCRSQSSVRLSFSILAAWALLAVLVPHSLLAQQDERSVRAAFVYNLTKYVIWPATARELNICVVGGGVTGPVLKFVIDGKVSDGRGIHVFQDLSDAELRRCNILYSSGPVTPRIRSILDRTRGTSVLTVGEDDRFVREGGMIGFVRTGDSIQIEVNIDSVRAGGLTISSRLLNLAQIVHAGRRG